MPVLIAAAAADIDIVRSLASLLRTEGGEVRCYLEEDDHELRQIGCKVATGDLDDAHRLDGALTNVHTFVPVFADALTIVANPAMFRAFAEAAAEALAVSSIEQVIVPISGLRPPGNEVTAVLVEAEGTLTTASAPTCIIRTGLMWGSERPGAGLAYRPGVSVVEVDLLARVLKEVDDREGTKGVWELGGSGLENTALETPNASDPNMQAWLDVLMAARPPGNSAKEEFL